MERKHILQRVACLCHPDPEVRIRAADQLETGVRPVTFPGLDAAIREGPDAGHILAVLGSLGITPVEAERLWVEMLPSPSALGPPAAAAALGILGCTGSAAALSARLRSADPPLYVQCVRALGRLRSPAAVPLLAAFALQPGHLPRMYRVRRLPPDGRLSRLAAACDWHRQYAPDASLRPFLGREWPHWSSQVGMSISSGSSAAMYESCTVSEPRHFACHELAAMGEEQLLRALSDLELGDAEEVKAAVDPRLFEALAVALVLVPHDPADRRLALAAVEALEALGGPWALGLLRWFGRSWLPLRSDQVVERAARASAERLRARLPGGRAEVVPSRAPDGSGAEVAPARGGPG